MTFNSRQHAGRLLAEELKKRNIRPDLVYGLARGGVVVAAPIAAAFNVPLEPLIVRKISPPGNPEFALGAVAGIPGSDPSAVRSVAKDGSEPSKISVWWDEDTIRRLGLTPDWQKQQIRDKKIEISNYLTQLNFRKNHMLPAPSARPMSRVRIERRGEWEAPSGSPQNLRKIILVDDGAATGATMLAAIEAVRRGVSPMYIGETPHKITVALPIVSTDAAAKIKRQADQTVILSVDSYFRAVGQYYRQFNQVSWDEVKTLLQLNNEYHPKTPPRKIAQQHD